jgi:UDP-N-acetylglucosamine--N-acetylmuramyl-(pentapeptide) pyrophosphoryl-undecaprenol N-acetylglucosamine transferase
MDRNVRIVLTGGGSGGHVYPALAIGEIAGERFPGAKLLFIGTPRGAESTIVPMRGIPMAHIPMESFRKDILHLALFGGVLLRAAARACGIMKKFDPDLVISSGGYCSGPVLLAGALLKKGGKRPGIFIHEQNVVAGLANRLGGRLADRIGTTFEESGRFFPARKVTHVGYPIRAPIASMGRADARRSLGIDEGAFVVFAFGGSAGSRTINRAVAGALPPLLAREDLHVIHAVGRYRGSDYDPEKDTASRVEKLGLGPPALKRYHRLLYTEEIGKYYAASDVVVSRCGSGTLFELKRAVKAAVLVPKMDSAGGHQLHNALAFEREGAGIVLKEKPGAGDGVMMVEGSELAARILDLKDGPDALRDMERRLRSSPLPDTRALVGNILEELLA